MTRPTYAQRVTRVSARVAAFEAGTILTMLLTWM